MPIPVTIRFVPAGGSLQYGAMIAPFFMPSGTTFEDAGILPAEEITGVQVTLLSSDGLSKAPVKSPKRNLGICRSLPIAVADIGERSSLVITEGIEEALTYHYATGLGAWASGGANFLPALAASIIATRVETVLIGIDENDAGIQNSNELARQLRAKNIEVLCLRPEAFNA